jgi:hypothetical protein
MGHRQRRQQADFDESRVGSDGASNRRWRPLLASSWRSPAVEHHAAGNFEAAQTLTNKACNFLNHTQAAPAWRSVGG